MTNELDRIKKLEKINAALMERVERSTDQQGNAFSLFQTAINLEGQVRRRTSELTNALMRLEQTNRELLLAKDAADQANLSKTRFLAAASHDVLQPLNAANLLLSALGEQEQTPKAKQLANQLEHSLETINEVLHSLLYISRLDAGVVQPQFEEIDIQDIFASLESDFRPIAESRNLDLRFRKSIHAVLSDRSMLRRILQNLISNALSYTEKGGVLVCCRPRSNSMLISVFDTGTGFEMNNANLLFEEFHRAVPKRLHHQEDKPGLGLGLSIVSRMCKMLEHDLQYNSIIDQGSSFSITTNRSTNLSTRNRRPSHNEGTSRLQGVFGTRILLLENDEAVVQAMLELFAQWHCEVRHGSNLEEAENCIAGDWKPQVIIADQQLDDGDLGTDIISDMRKRLGESCAAHTTNGSISLPAILITADPSDTVRQYTDKHGVELMMKPVKPAQLRALLTHVIAKEL